MWLASLYASKERKTHALKANIAKLPESIPHEACPAGDGNGKIGRQAAYLPDCCLRDGVGGRNGNSRLLAAQFSAPKLIFGPDNLVREL
jgi:hypothetical protein